MVDFKEREQQLRARLEELSGRLHRIEDELEDKPDPNWEENATESELDEVLEGLGKSGAIEIDAIHAALARIKGGSYGICIHCGETISEARLDAVPTTASCRTCANAAARSKA